MTSPFEFLPADAFVAGPKEQNDEICRQLAVASCQLGRPPQETGPAVGPALFAELQNWPRQLVHDITIGFGGVAREQRLLALLRNGLKVSSDFSGVGGGGGTLPASS